MTLWEVCYGGWLARKFRLTAQHEMFFGINYSFYILNLWYQLNVVWPHFELKYDINNEVFLRAKAIQWWLNSKKLWVRMWLTVEPNRIQSFDWIRLDSITERSIDYAGFVWVEKSACIFGGLVTSSRFVDHHKTQGFFACAELWSYFWETSWDQR